MVYENTIADLGEIRIGLCRNPQTLQSDEAVSMNSIQTEIRHMVIDISINNGYDGAEALEQDLDITSTSREL